MYENVQRKKGKNGKEWKLAGVTGLAVVVIVFVIALLIGSYMYYTSFRTFVGQFSRSTSINYRKGGVTVTTTEETFELTQDNIYFVYNCIINAGRGRIGEPPEREPDAVLEYKFGGRLELWETAVENNRTNRDTGLFIRYIGEGDYVYAYDTDRLTLDRLPLTARENTKQ